MDGAQARIVDAFNDAWGAHDLETCIAMLTDDCLFDSTGPAPDGTPYIGPAAIRAAWQPIFDDPSSHFEVEELCEAGDGHVVQRWRYEWDGGHVRGIDLFLVRDGRIAEKRSYVKG